MIIAIVVMYFETLILLFTAIVMKNHYSEFPDTSVGFHISYALENKEIWEEANQYAGRLGIRSSLCLLVLNFAVTCYCLFFKGNLSEDHWIKLLLIYMFVALSLQLILLLILPYRHLKKKFNKITTRTSDY